MPSKEDTLDFLRNNREKRIASRDGLQRQIEGLTITIEALENDEKDCGHI